MLFPFFEWCEASAIGQAIRESLWLFPVIEAAHLLGLAAIGGAVFTVDFRLLGVGLRQPIREIARDARPWLLGSIVMMLTTGISLFLSEAVKCYYNPSFWIKMYALFPALLFTFAIKPRFLRREDSELGPGLRRTIALISIGLWLTVAAAGRWIGFSA
jgi:hypothetical protein